jgi:hypothetical protein
VTLAEYCFTGAYACNGVVPLFHNPSLRTLVPRKRAALSMQLCAVNGAKSERDARVGSCRSRSIREVGT